MLRKNTAKKMNKSALNCWMKRLRRAFCCCFVERLTDWRLENQIDIKLHTVTRTMKLQTHRRRLNMDGWMEHREDVKTYLNIMKVVEQLLFQLCWTITKLSKGAPLIILRKVFKNSLSTIRVKGRGKSMSKNYYVLYGL